MKKHFGDTLQVSETGKTCFDITFHPSGVPAKRAGGISQASGAAKMRFDIVLQPCRGLPMNVGGMQKGFGD